MDIGKVQPREITEEMQESYLDYAMSVIVARALPDCRDGLKPVHRRILFAMREMGLTHAAKYRKCAAVVGDVLGKYHPHGESAVYDSLVRMAQPFSLRYPLVDGQGNFGSLDGDSAAAMRYTEARLTAIAEEALADLEKETVPFSNNYDATRKEPQVLPAKIPQLLLNGSVGIAVGMATNIPPHNLGELVDAIFALMEDPDASTEELLKYVKGPDFPTGGAIFGTRAIEEAYGQGRGPFVVRGVAEVVERERGGGHQIVITEIPYQVEKAGLIVKMAELVREKKIEGVRDIRDESDREGLRIALDLRSDSYPQKILNRLYKFTDLQKTFHLNMLALVDGIQPQLLSLRSALLHFLEHRKVVVRRRTEFDRARARERLHILEGLTKALAHIDVIVKLIKASRDKEEAHENLRKRFRFSDAQASAILAMPLANLAGLERKHIEAERVEKQALVKELEAILASPKRILKIIREELEALKTRFGDERRTKIVAHEAGELAEEDLVPDEEVVVMMTEDGSIKRMSPTQFRAQQRGGKGVAGLSLREEDVVRYFTACSTHDALLFFTTRGRVFRINAWEILESARQAKGKSIANFLSLSPGEDVSVILPFSKDTDQGGYLFLATRGGLVKKMPRKEFSVLRRSGLIALALKSNDALSWAQLTSGNDNVILVTGRGKGIVFSEKDVRPMGRNAAGVRGIRLGNGDSVVGMAVLNASSARSRAGQEGKRQDPLVLIITENGFGKRTKFSQFRKQRRGGSGIKAAQITQKTGSIVSGRVLEEEAEELIAISKKGQVLRTMVQSISVLGRATQGVRIMRLKAGDTVASFIVL